MMVLVCIGCVLLLMIMLPATIYVIISMFVCLNCSVSAIRVKQFAMVLDSV